MTTHTGGTTSELGRLLKAWRGTRGMSQIELSLETGVSQRHLSFIESGRSSPSRQTLMLVAEGLDMPFRERNQLLLAAGYAPQYMEEPWDAASFAIVRHALERMLLQHEPYPAVVMDRYWNVVMANDAFRAMLGSFIDLERYPKPRNILQMVFDPQGLRPFVVDWERSSASLLQRVRREAVGGTIDDPMHALLASLHAVGDVRDLATDDKSADLPVIPLTLADATHRLSYFSLVTTVGTPRAPGPQELRLECMAPVDTETEAWHRV
ncbi:MAG TPA: helix-turn-helix transcriptional regulator [Luteibacter sp.]|jgi:transcriptional regulator with XRE-family HTH domain|uniref:helix-turn-helix domain-containing protein n=1 Tax=Luteibacter sp. TaxID=1886636 RepID=UPI002F40C741